MLPTNPGGHAAYQDTFVSEFLIFYPDPFVLSKDTWDYIIQFWYLDLSLTDSIMQVCYSVFGPEPRLPSCIFKGGRRKELQQEIDGIDIQISNMKKRLSSIVKEYKFDSVQTFYKEFKAAKSEYLEYKAACAEWEKTYGEKVTNPMSIIDRLRQKEQIVKEREAGRVHQARQKDKEAR